MWLWLLTALILVQNTGNAAPSSLGPTSDSEAEILWNEGKSALQASRFQEAVNSLQRYVDRYPDKPDHLKAQFLLGSALRGIDKNHEAIPLLTAFIGAAKISTESAKARIELCKAYLKINKKSEAFLAAQDAERVTFGIKTSSDLQIQALLVKAEVLLGLNRDSLAIRTLESAEKMLTNQSDPGIKGLTYQLQINVKTRICSHLNLKGSLDESQIRNQLERRGSCLLEALLEFRKTLETGDRPASEQAASHLGEAFVKYHQICSHPPRPSSMGKSERIISQYQKELADLLIQDCRKKSSNALELLESWKPKIPTSTQNSAIKVSQNLVNLISRSE